MLALFYYGIKVVVCSAILYTYYLLVLRNNRFHQWNRWYLLLAVVVSFTLPLLQIPLPDLSDTQPIHQGVRLVAAPDFYFATVQQADNFHFDWPLVATLVYSSISLFFLLLFLRQLLLIRKIRQFYPKETFRHIRFYHTREPNAPFSFFRDIFWHTDVSLHTGEGRQMLRHEMTHVQQWHSVDKVFLEIVTAFAFWNPFLYYIRKELSVVHEFIADQKASAGDDHLQYASLLLSKVLGSESFHLGNPFFHSQLKRRFIMLTTSNIPRFSYFRRVMVIPLTVVAIALFSTKYNEIKAREKEMQQRFSAADGFTDEVHLADSSAPVFSIRLPTTYQGVAIESIVPAADLSGIMVKTTGNQDYFLDRTAARQALNFVLTDSGFIIPAGAVLVVNQQELALPQGETVTYKKPAGRLQAPFTTDRLFANQRPLYAEPAADNLQINNGSMSLDLDGNLAGFKEALFIVDGVKMNLTAMKQLSVNQFTTMDILKSDRAVALYGASGKNGAVIIQTNHAGTPQGTNKQDGNPELPASQHIRPNGVVKLRSETDPDQAIFIRSKASLPDGLLYILDGQVSTKDALEALPATAVVSIDVLKDVSATARYGEQGKNGVVLVTTRRSFTKNALYIVDGKEVTVEQAVKVESRIASMNVLKGPEAIKFYGRKGKNGVILIATKKEAAPSLAPSNNSTPPAEEKIVIGYRKSAPDTLRIRPVSPPAETITVTGYGSKSQKDGAAKTDSPKEIVVTGYGTRPAKSQAGNAANTDPAKEIVVTGYRTRPAKSQAGDAANTDPSKEIVVTGYRTNSAKSQAGNTANTDPAKEIVVTGYRTSPAKFQTGDVAKTNPLKEVVVVGNRISPAGHTVATVEEPAVFTGGQQQWQRYLERNLQYPPQARQNGTQGIVKLKITIAANGTVTDVEALNDPGNGLAAEAIRVVKTGPAWKPATDQGQPVASTLLQSIAFRLQ